MSAFNRNPSPSKGNEPSYPTLSNAARRASTGSDDEQQDAQMPANGGINDRDDDVLTLRAQVAGLQQAQVQQLLSAQVMEKNVEAVMR